MADQARPVDDAGGADEADHTTGRNARSADDGAPPDEDRRRRRAAFLRELDEARELRARVTPLRSKVERERRAVRMRTFRY